MDTDTALVNARTRITSPRIREDGSRVRAFTNGVPASLRGFRVFRVQPYLA